MGTYFIGNSYGKPIRKLLCFHYNAYLFLLKGWLIFDFTGRDLVVEISKESLNHILMELGGSLKRICFIACQNEFLKATRLCAGDKQLMV